jgi:hypothetical protein
MVRLSLFAVPLLLAGCSGATPVPTQNKPPERAAETPDNRRVGPWRLGMSFAEARAAVGADAGHFAEAVPDGFDWWRPVDEESIRHLNVKVLAPHAGEIHGYFYEDTLYRVVVEVGRGKHADQAWRAAAAGYTPLGREYSDPLELNFYFRGSDDPPGAGCANLPDHKAPRVHKSPLSGDGVVVALTSAPGPGDGYLVVTYIDTVLVEKYREPYAKKRALERR